MSTTSEHTLESRLKSQIAYIEKNYPGKNQLYLNLLKDSLAEINRLQKKVRIQTKLIQHAEKCIEGNNKAYVAFFENIIQDIK